MIDIQEVLSHWYAGRSKAELARSLGIDRKTLRKYLAPAEAAGYAPGGPSVAGEEWARRVREWFPELVAPELRSRAFAEIARHHDLIKEGLVTNRLATVHQRLRDEQGLRASLSSVRRYVRLALPEQAARAAVTVRKPDPPPGEEAQIDYGYLGPWRDPRRGTRRRVWAFCMVLSASRHMFVLPVVAMTLAAWAEAHVLAFRFFGGVPRRLVIDNLRAGVVRADLYDPRLNRGYAELAHHYGCLVDPARRGHPKDKPRVERQVPYVRESFFRGRDFASLEAMQAAAAAWALQVAGRRAARPLGGAAPLEVFRASEAALLLPLPERDYEPAAWWRPKVAPDAHVAVEGALYSVPWTLIGRVLDARASAREVALYSEGELVKTHARVPKGRRATDWGDYPPEKVAFLQRTPAWCRRRAAALGAATGELCEGLLQGGGLHHLRAVQGVIGLAERHGGERLEAACARALAAGDPSYRTVKGILAAGLEQAPAPAQPAPSRVPAFLHGAHQLVLDEGTGR